MDEKRNFHWENWPQNIDSIVEKYFEPETTGEIAAIVRDARENGKVVRVIGDSHLWSPLCATPNYLISTKNLKSLKIDKAHDRRVVRVGTAVSDSVGVIIGANGFPRLYSPYSDFVHEIKFVDGTGEVRTINKTKDVALWKCVACGLGLFGIITEITLELRPTFNVGVVNKNISMEEELERLTDIISSHDKEFPDVKEIGQQIRELFGEYLEKFLIEREKYDPDNIFVNDFLGTVFNLEVPLTKFLDKIFSKMSGASSNIKALAIGEMENNREHLLKRSTIIDYIYELMRQGPNAHELNKILLHFVENDPEYKNFLRLPEFDYATFDFVKEKALEPARFTPALFTRPRKIIIPGVNESNGKPMECYGLLEFKNWGRTVNNIPELTFVPKTKEGLCQLVKWARSKNKKIRVAGYRHTWGDLYSSTGQILVSMLKLDIVEKLPANHPEMDPHNEFEGIKIVGEVEENGKMKKICKIGAATTNEHFRRWCLDGGEGKGNKKWTLPLNVIMVEITMGGSNATICHGAGHQQKTLSDLVHEVEFVDFNGNLQQVSDPEQLKAAAGSFGLLGIVTSLTFKLEPMTHAKMEPVKDSVLLTIPPPKDFKLPRELEIERRKISENQLQAARIKFEQRCQQYYSEWFWFPGQKQCWINTWNNDGDEKESKKYPSPIETKWQELQTYLAEIANSSIFKILPDICQVSLLSNFAMRALPSDVTITCPLIEALHFRRGIQNMRVKDMEFEIPIPLTAEGKPDWNIAQRAWWDAIALYYEFADKSKYPMRLPLEMRIMGGSDVLMAAQYGNTYTCSIEVLTTKNVPQEEWLEFMQALANKWAEYKGYDDKPLNTRPHWAKEWEKLTFRDEKMKDYLVRAYQYQLSGFRERLIAIGKKCNFTLDDLRIFSNPLLDDLVFNSNLNVNQHPVFSHIQPISITQNTSAHAIESDASGSNKEVKTNQMTYTKFISGPLQKGEDNEVSDKSEKANKQSIIDLQQRETQKSYEQGQQKEVSDVTEPSDDCESVRLALIS